MLSRIGIALFWLLHWLPLKWLAPVGEGLGTLLYALAAPRRRIALANLAACFPQLSEADRVRLARSHFRAAGRALLERGVLWWGSAERIRQMVQIEGKAHLDAALEAGRPVILLAPHFVGLDAGGTRVAMEYDCVSIYARQNDPVLDRWLYHGRSRFGDQLLLSRQDGVRATVKAMKAGRPFYYLPDLDYGVRDALFVPFFGVPAATITGLSRLARLAGALVLPCVTRMLPGGQGYRVEIGAPWLNYPSDDVKADTRRMNAAIEDWVRTMPEQYYWVHRRFKHRPEGLPSLYPPRRR